MSTFQELLGERQYVSQYAIGDVVGFVVHVGGVPTDPDGATADVAIVSLDGSTTIHVGSAADHPATGTFEYALHSADTARPGIWQTVWTFTLNGVPEVYVGLLEVGEASPAYDKLDSDYRAVVEQTWSRFADLFDSPYGGPHLQVYFQSRFTRGRMAQLLQLALNRLNAAAQPRTVYTLDGVNGAKIPVGTWGAILDAALYIEALKHLVRSYVEQPANEGISVSVQDRRDYMDRWRMILQEEEALFQPMFEVFKIAHMGLGRPKVLVSGGAYGNYGPTRLPGSAAARPRYWARFF